MRFEIIGEIEAIQTIAIGVGVKVRPLLRRMYGRGRWRKRKGIGTAYLPNGKIRRVELHWDEAHGIGRRDLKIEKDLGQPGDV